jgi:hypothetical protein
MTTGFTSQSARFVIINQWGEKKRCGGEPK